MSQSLANVLIHLVFSTKHRMPWIPPDVRPALYAYQAGILRQCDSPAIIIGGVDDHVHALFHLSRTKPLAKVVEELKKRSSKWMKCARGSQHPGFCWQNGYAAFSVSSSQRTEVIDYIKNQDSRHRTLSFEDELRQLLAKHAISFDERYIWK